MPAKFDQVRLPRPPPPEAIIDESLEAMLRNFPCWACGRCEVQQTERESWYTCGNCGYSCGITDSWKSHQRTTKSRTDDGTSH